MGRVPGGGRRRRREGRPLDARRAGRVAILRAVPRPGDVAEARDAVVDGEVIALDEHGEPDFALLQARIKGRGTAAEPNPFLYEVFDLLHLDGRSLIDEPLEERRRLLASILRADPRVRLSEHIEAGGSRSSKRPGPGASKGSWPRTDARRTSPASAPTAGRRSRSARSRSSSSAAGSPGTGTAVDLGALLVGVYEDGELRYVGKVGAGFTADRRSELLARVAPLAAEASPFSPPVPRAAARGANWLRPELVVRAEFAGWTGDGASGRRRTRASSSRRIHARSSASARRRRGRQEATMAKVRVAGFSVSIDGFGAGPDQSLDDPLGKRGEELHEWIVHTRMFHADDRRAGRVDGRRRRSSRRARWPASARSSSAATCSARSATPWPDDDLAGLVGRRPAVPRAGVRADPLRRPPIEMEGGTMFHFVTEGIEVGARPRPGGGRRTATSRSAAASRPCAST